MGDDVSTVTKVKTNAAMVSKATMVYKAIVANNPILQFLEMT
jgi:hypothetical protein